MGVLSDSINDRKLTQVLSPKTMAKVYMWSVSLGTISGPVVQIRD